MSRAYGACRDGGAGDTSRCPSAFGADRCAHGRADVRNPWLPDSGSPWSDLTVRASDLALRQTPVGAFRHE